jgi:hypothetical protein
MAFIEDFSWIKKLEDRKTRNEPEYVERVDELVQEQVDVRLGDNPMWFKITPDGSSWQSTTDPREANYYGAQPEMEDGSYSHLIGRTDNAPEFSESIPEQTFDINGQPQFIYQYDTDGVTIIGWEINPSYNPNARKPGTKPGTTPGTGTDAAATAKQDAFAVVDDLVRSYGLDQSVADFIKGEMKIGQSRTAIAMKIRDLPAYNLRFPAMKARIDAGLPALTENEYMALETDYRSAMQAADLPPNFSDGPEDFAALIEGDVSVAELQSRVALAEQALDTANQDTIAQLQNFYDLPKGSLTAYFLDPDRAKNVFEQNRRMEAAGLSAGAMRAIGPSQGLGKGTAERLQREGVAQSQLVQRLSDRRGLAEATLGAEALTADELALGEFGITPESVTRIRRETEQRASRFAGQAGTLMDRTGFSGLGEAN